jgi:fibronectin-binding autotransporter adhesin
MKIKSLKFRTPIWGICLASFGLATAPAATLYWDLNGTTAGSGNTGGTWDTTALNWNTDVTGAAGGTLQAFATGDTVNFSAGSDGTGSLTFSVSGTIQAAAINFLQNGNKTINGGSLSVASNLAISAAGRSNSDTYTISSLLTGTGNLSLASNGDTSDTGGGVGGAISLTNTSNDFTGGITISSGVVAFASGAVFGNAANVITISGGGLVAQGNRSLSHNISLAGGGDRIFRVYGGSTLTLSGTISGTGTVRHTDGGTLQINGVASHSGNIIAAGGSGRVVALGAVNTYTGYTLVRNSSTLRLDLNEALPNTTSVVLYGSTLFNVNGRTDTFSSLTTGSSSDTSATINLGTGASLKLTNNNLPAGITSGYANATVHGKITGSGNFEYAHSASDNGQWDIANNTNDFIGDWTISRGRIRFQPNALADTALGNANNDIFFNGDVVNTLNNNAGKASIQVTNGQSITFGANRTVTLNSAKEGTFYVWSGTTHTIEGKITGAGNLRKEDGGVLLLSNTTNDYSGETKVVTGELRLNAAGTLPDATLVRIGNATLNIQGFTETVAGLSSVQTSDSAVFTGGFVTGSGTLVVNTSGTQQFGGSLRTTLRMDGTGSQALTGTVDNEAGKAIVNSGTLLLGKASTATVHAVGATNANALTINGGIVSLSGTGGDQIYTDSHVEITSGTFNLNGFNEGFRALKGTGGSITNNGATASLLTLGENGVLADNFTYAGVISDGSATTAVTKTGSGTQVLSGMNTYSGATIINGGTLLLGNNNTLPNTSALTLGSGAKFASGGYSDSVGNFTLSGNAVIDLGGGTGTSIITFSDITAWSGVLSIWNWNGDPGLAGISGIDTRLLFSNGTLNAAQLADVHFYSDNGTTEVGPGGAMFVGTELVPIPEPNALSMGLFLLLTAAFHRRR